MKAVSVSSESCGGSSVRTNFLFNLWVSLATKRLLFISYKNQKRAAKYSSLIPGKQPSVNFDLLHNNYCAHAPLSPTCVKIQFFLPYPSIDPDNPGKPQCLPHTTQLYTCSPLLQTMLSSLTHSNSFWAILIIHWQEMLLISFINHIDFCFHYFCSSSVTLLMNVWNSIRSLYIYFVT